MLIRNARTGEIDLLMEMYNNARIFMAEHGNPNQWGTNKPERSAILQDISEGHSYVCEQDGSIVAVFFFKPGVDETYLKIYKGQWLDDTDYGVVHRITSDGSTKGAASFCLEWALKQCGNIRIDTHRDNYVMQNMLKKNGFVYCGIIHLVNGDERLAYQKKADDKDREKG